MSPPSIDYTRSKRTDAAIARFHDSKIQTICDDLRLLSVTRMPLTSLILSPKRSPGFILVHSLLSRRISLVSALAILR